jgi:hypothetical protein
MYQHDEIKNWWNSSSFFVVLACVLVLSVAGFIWWDSTRPSPPLPTITGTITQVQMVAEDSLVQTAYVTYEGGKVVRLRLINDHKPFAFYIGKPTVLTHNRRGYIKSCEVQQ